MKGITKKELKAEYCRTYKFLSVNGIRETAEVLEIQARCESDAWDLLEEDKPSNISTEFILSDKLEKQLNKCLGNLNI